MTQFDLTVIGTGPGGYVCAIRAAQLGMKVAVVEKRAKHGGTCLNIGCIPSKALLHASEMFAESRHTFEKMGITGCKPKMDIKQLMAFKQEAIDGNTKGIEFLFRKNRITPFHGTGRIDGPGRVEVTAPGGTGQTITTSNIVIATGSQVARLPGIEIDEKQIVSSTGALEFTSPPRHLVVVGAGVIGLELGSVWARLGTKITVVEFLDRILPGMDGDIAKTFQRLLKKQGFDFHLSTRVTEVKKAKSSVTVSIEPATGGKAEQIRADAVLIAIGRIPYTQNLGLEKTGIKTGERGQIEINEHFQTSTKGIYAIGDCVRGPMLAHKAEDEGIAVAEIISGQAGHVNYGVIPGVVYTTPEIASVGKTEEDLKAANIQYTAGKFPFIANGRAKANQTADGFVKVLADAGTDRVLGVHILGPQAGELIHEAAVLMEFGGSAEDLARTCHAHPTFSEAVKEAALAVAKRAIHA